MMDPQDSEKDARLKKGESCLIRPQKTSKQNPIKSRDEVVFSINMVEKRIKLYEINKLKGYNAGTSAKLRNSKLLFFKKIKKFA